MFRQMQRWHKVKIWTRYRQCQFWGYISLLSISIPFLLMSEPDLTFQSDFFFYAALSTIQVFIYAHFGIKVAGKKWQVDKAHRVLSALKTPILVLATSAVFTLVDMFSHIFLYPKLFDENVVNFSEFGGTNASISGFFRSYVGKFLTVVTWSVIYHWYINRRENKRLHRQIVHHSLQSLQYRINPSALSRALRVIQAEIIQNKENAADLVTDLSSLLRYNLTAGQRTHVSLQEEWHFLLIFVKLHNLSKIDKKTLTVREKGMAEAGELGIPSCLLQDIAQALISSFGRDLELMQWCFSKQSDELLISFEANMSKAVTAEQFSASLQTVQYQLAQQFPIHKTPSIKYQSMAPSLIIYLPIKEI